MASSVSRYFRAYKRFVLNSILEEMEYRASFVFRNLASLLWVVSSIFFITVIFSQAQTIGSVDKSFLLLLYLVFLITNDLMDILFRSNLERFSRLVRKGELDGFLLKPINIRFLVTFMSDRISLYALARLISGIVLLIYFGRGYPLFNWLNFSLFWVLGFISVINFIFILHTLNIWFTKLDNITHLAHTSVETIKVPLSSWPKIIQTIFIYMFPVGIVSTFAINALVGTPAISSFYIAPLVALVLLLFSQWFWQFALRHYSSASS